MRIAHCFNVPTIYPFLSPTRLSIVSLSSSSYEYSPHRTKSPEDAKREIMLSYMIDPEMLDAYADLEIRGLAEVRAWLQSVGILPVT